MNRRIDHSWWLRHLTLAACTTSAIALPALRHTDDASLADALPGQAKY